MTPRSIGDALELGLFGLALFILALPFLIPYWLWRYATRDDY